MGGVLMDRMLKMGEVAERLGVSRPMVSRLMAGKVKNMPMLPHVAFGARKLVRESSLQRYVDAVETGKVNSAE